MGQFTEAGRIIKSMPTLSAIPSRDFAETRVSEMDCQTAGLSSQLSQLSELIDELGRRLHPVTKAVAVKTDNECRVGPVPADHIHPTAPLTGFIASQIIRLETSTDRLRDLLDALAI